MRNLKELCALLIASVGGIGFCPYAPGTALSALATLAIFFHPPLSVGNYVLSFVVLCIIGTVCAEYLAGLYKKRDPQFIVIDELCGMMVALFMLPRTPLIYFCSFLLFRFFDIEKPFPVKSGERLSGGLGIMADDIIAGGLSLFIMHLFIFVMRCFMP